MQARTWRRRWLAQESVLGYGLVAPLVVWLAVVLFYPLMSTIWLSFFDRRLASPMVKFVGFGNYVKYLTDPTLGFWAALGRSGVWTVATVALQIAIAMGVAVLLNQRFRGSYFLRSAILMPWVIPVVVVAVMARWMLHTAGVINYLLQSRGLSPAPVVFFSTENAFATVLGVFTWREFPFVAIVLLASLKNVPEEILDAAVVDGATAWQRFWRVTLPTIRPSVALMALLSTFWAFNQFPTIWLTTEGGPADVTTTLPVLVYRTAFRSMRLGEGAALSVVMFACLAAFLVIYFRLSRMLAEE